MILQDVIAAIRPEAITSPEAATVSIRSVHYRAQDVVPGGLFVAIRGFAADGHDFVDRAVANGAVAVVTQIPTPGAVPVLQVPDTRKALAQIAAAF